VSRVLIPPGYKYATIGLPIGDGHLDLIAGVELGPYVITPTLPVGVPAHWREWLGSIQISRLEDCDLFVTVRSHSTAPEILDSENESLRDLSNRFYQGLLITIHNIRHGIGRFLTGANRDGQLDVRSTNEYPEVRHILFSPQSDIDQSALEMAAQIAEAFGRLHDVGPHNRIWRLQRAFYAAVGAAEVGERIHQLVRVVEGLVYPRVGQSRDDFIQRTKLFIGPGYEQLTGDLYDIRSSVEHLHGPLSPLPQLPQRERTILLLRRAVQAEWLARYCLQRLFLTPDLWPYVTEQVGLETFWRLAEARQRELWGSVGRIDVATDGFHEEWIEDRDLGIRSDDDELGPTES
jgi:hypothetical protein